MTEMKRNTRWLPVALTDEEVVERAAAVGECQAEIEKIEREKKEMARTFKEKVDELNARSARLAREVRDRAEHRHVPVYFLTTGGRIDTIREDTGEIIHSRETTPEEEALARAREAPLFEGEDAA